MPGSVSSFPSCLGADAEVNRPDCFLREHEGKGSELSLEE